MHDNIRFFPDNNKHNCADTNEQSLSLKRLTLYVLVVPTLIVSVIIAAVGVFVKPNPQSMQVQDPMHTTYLLTASSGKQLCLSNVIGVSLQSDLLIFDLATGKAFFPASKFFALPLGPMPIDEGMAMCDVIMRATEKATAPKADGPA